MVLVFNSVEDMNKLKCRLLALPWSGGSAQFYRKWKPWAKQNNIELLSAEIKQPEKDPSTPEEANKVIGDIVEDIYVSLKEFGRLDRPLAIWGHSLGGIVAYELSRRLESVGCEPIVLMVSSVFAPLALSERNSGSDDCKRSLLTDRELMDNVIATGGLPKGVDESFLELKLPKLRSDLVLFDNYSINTITYTRLKCPIVTFGGADDEAGTAKTMVEWQHYSERDLGARVMDCHHSFARGNHFYFQMTDYKDNVLSLILDEVHRHLDLRRPRSVTVIDGFI